MNTTRGSTPSRDEVIKEPPFEKQEVLLVDQSGPNYAIEPAPLLPPPTASVNTARRAPPPRDKIEESLVREDDENELEGSTFLSPIQKDNFAFDEQSGDCFPQSKKKKKKNIEKDQKKSESTHTDRKVAPTGRSSSSREGQVVHEEARKGKAAHMFWTNRLHLLRREVEAARLKAHMRRLEDDHHEVSALTNTTAANQLKAERERIEAHRLERADAIRQQREDRRTAFRATFYQTLIAKLEGGRQMRAEAALQRSMVERLREEVLNNKKATRERIVEEKERAMETRLKERTLREEKSRYLYTSRIRHLKEETYHRNEETRALIGESGVLLEQLRRLQRLDRAKGGTVSASEIEDAVH